MGARRDIQPTSSPRVWREEQRPKSRRDHYSPPSSPKRTNYTQQERDLDSWTPPRWIKDRANDNLGRESYTRPVDESHNGHEPRPVPSWIMRRAHENFAREGYTYTPPPEPDSYVHVPGEKISSSSVCPVEHNNELRSESTLGTTPAQDLHTESNIGSDLDDGYTKSVRAKQQFQKFKLVKPEFVSPTFGNKNTLSAPNAKQRKRSRVRALTSTKKTIATHMPTDDGDDIRAPALFIDDVEKYPTKEMPDWYTMIKESNLAMKEIRKKRPQALTSLDAMKNCITRCESEAKPKELSGLYFELRDIVHKAEIAITVDKFIIKASSILTTHNGLPRIFREESNFPTDLKADSYQLYLKWMRAEFDNNILRGIITVKGDTSNGDRLDTDYRKQHPVDPYLYGDAGFVLGQWWPTQMCLLRDGAHGMTQAGITSGEDGAYSIVLSSSEYHDKDDGDMIEYSGTKGKGNFITSEGTKSLLSSADTKNPVRVIRSSQLPKKNPCRPDCGFRYDGLYTVTGYKCLDPEFQVHRFTLERSPNQEPIRCVKDGSQRPSDYEYIEYEAMKRKYW